MSSICMISCAVVRGVIGIPPEREEEQDEQAELDSKSENVEVVEGRRGVGAIRGDAVDVVAEAEAEGAGAD
jgi:hypothetical protein